MFIKKLKGQVVCGLHEPVVTTPKGKLRGLKSDGTYIFRGIKYADAKRYCMPKPVAPWEGVKDAIIYGLVCPEIRANVPGDQYTVPHVFYPAHEDCQYLNVWTKSLDPNAKRPVMVWLHGGGFSTGSGIEHYAYDGEELAAFGDVVVVTLNHRLNVLGYLDLSAYGEQYAHSGNLGMHDIVAALRWVKENIACFGGDPDCVTVFGQSGGGGKVLTLMQMPSADGLYHRAIVQSGVIVPEAGEVVRARNRRVAELVLDELGIAPQDAKRIETVPWRALAKAANRANLRVNREQGCGFMWAPVPYGDDYAGYTFEVGFRAQTQGIPVMCGTVFSEFTSNSGVIIGDRDKNSWDAATTAAHMAAHYGERAEGIARAFAAAYPGRNPADALFADGVFRGPTVELAKLRAQCGPVYNYLFDLEMPYMDGTLAWHNAEIPYVFHNAQYIESSYIPGVSEALQDAMACAWVSFAKTGDPNHAGMPAWTAASADSCPTMIFGRETRQAVDHDAALIGALRVKRTLPDFLAPKDDEDGPFGREI